MVCDLGRWWVEVSRFGGDPPLVALAAPSLRERGTLPPGSPSPISTPLDSGFRRNDGGEGVEWQWFWNGLKRGWIVQDATVAALAFSLC